MLLGGQPAQARTFTPVGETKGLEARVVPAVMLDSKGFLWVGSREGLFRYDGYQAQAFLPERGNVDAISDIDIRSVYEAADGCIWVGTNTGGLDHYDPDTGKIRNFRHDAADPASIIADSVNAVMEGPDDFVAASSLPVSHFNTNASGSDEGHTYFGSTGGLLVIPKGTLLDERQSPTVRLTAMHQSE